MKSKYTQALTILVGIILSLLFLNNGAKERINLHRCYCTIKIKLLATLPT